MAGRYAVDTTVMVVLLRGDTGNDDIEQRYALWVVRSSGGYRAAVLGRPGIGAWGATREAAISRARDALAQAAARGEIVSVTLGVEEPNPWLEDAGIWKEDPQWDEYQAAIEEYRT